MHHVPESSVVQCLLAIGGNVRSKGDLTGKQFHHWLVLSPAPKMGEKKRWRCRCVCGRERDVFQYVLFSGNSTSCGCRNGEDLTGQKFGDLVALRPVLRGDRIRVWLCQCVCGKEHLARPDALKRGKTTSCGCEGMKRRKEALKKLRKEPGAAAKNLLYAKYKSSAKKRGREFSLTKEEFHRLTCLNCHYCGSPPSNHYRDWQKEADAEWAEKGAILYNGIDRVNNDRGYVCDNVVPCCFVCNRAKHTMSEEEFRAWIARLVNHQITSGTT